ncbi:ATP-binding protein [Roseofilum capinflatum]|uniref:histidine kinase n=1 Tax=Roseofilum capinflatum BLCC-M114 TaxID=3022440 RepID=A0ABT7B4T8_9CYAN|nr:ATP-binding protein [Roseofilum capinflatum]MDJ1174192.1 ATP-binding protein [Roseofilum capinflatum BLCC-M114]
MKPAIFTQFRRLQQWWNRLSITTKFSTGFGGLFGLIILVSINSYIALTIVQGQAKEDIAISVELQRLVLEMDRHLQEARTHQRDFFLRYPEIGFNQAKELYAQKAVESIDRVVQLTSEFKTLIEQPQVSPSLKQTDVDLKLFVSSAQRYEDTFIEAVELVTQLAEDETGLQVQLDDLGRQGRKAIQSLDIQWREQYQALRLAEKEYLITRQRPYMQSAFNLLLELQNGISEDESINTEQKVELFNLLESYRYTAEKLVQVNTSIESRFRDFDLQAQTIDEISGQLITLTNEEVIKAENKVGKASQLIYFILLSSALFGLFFIGIVARLFKNGITQRILKLTQGVNQLKQGSLDHRLSIESEDELGELAAGFNQMASQLQTLVNDLEQQVAEKTVAIRKSEALLNETQKIGQLGGWEFNPQTQQLIWTQEVYQIHQVEPEYVPTLEGMLSFFEEKYKIKLKQKIDEAIAHLTDFDLELPLIPDSGDLIWVRVIGQPFQVEDQGVKLKGTLQNITDRKEIEIALQQAKQEADSANQAKTEFLSSMSHELRTPLNGILGYTQILKRSKTLEGEDRKGVEVIHECGSHLLTLINDILDMAKIESRKIELDEEPLELSYFLDGVTSICKIKAHQKKLGFKSIYSPQLPKTIIVDPKRLRQVLINLIGNAIKFTDTGEITFEVNVLDSISKDGQQFAKIRFQVEDTGIGITPEQLEKIFSPFEQAGDKSRMSEGTGLGLAISQNIVQLMGGQLQVASVPNEGSRFFFEIQCLLAEDQTPAECSIQEHLVTGYLGRRRTILVIDDRWDHRSLVVNLLNSLGFVVIEATDGQEGLKEAKKVKPDLIITDIFMPVMDGLELTQILRHLHELKHIPIIISSASISGLEAESNQGLDCNDFIAKPIDTDVLLSSLKKHLNLTWIYAENQELDHLDYPIDQAKNSSLVPMTFPPKSELEKLYHSARIGDIEDMENEIKRLGELDEDYYAFVRYTSELLDEFAIEEIRVLLEDFFQKVENSA